MAASGAAALSAAALPPCFGGLAVAGAVWQASTGCRAASGLGCPQMEGVSPSKRAAILPTSLGVQGLLWPAGLGSSHPQVLGWVWGGLLLNGRWCVAPSVDCRVSLLIGGRQVCPFPGQKGRDRCRGRLGVLKAFSPKAKSVFVSTRSTRQNQFLRTRPFPSQTVNESQVLSAHADAGMTEL